MGRCCKTYNCFGVTSLRAARVVSLKDSSAFLQPSSPQTALLCHYDGSRILRAKARQHILLKTYQYLQSKRDGFSAGLWDCQNTKPSQRGRIGINRTCSHIQSQEKTDWTGTVWVTVRRSWMRTERHVACIDCRIHGCNRLNVVSTPPSSYVCPPKMHNP